MPKLSHWIVVFSKLFRLFFLFVFIIFLPINILHASSSSERALETNEFRAMDDENDSDTDKAVFAKAEWRSDFPAVKTITLVTPEVEFDLAWRREYKASVGNKYMDYIRTRFAEILTEELHTALSKAYSINYADSDENLADDALVLRANIHRLHLYGPETNPPQDVLTKHAGHASIDFTVESEGDVIGEIRDHRITSARGSLQMPNTRVDTERDFRKVMKFWSVGLLGEMMDQKIEALRSKLPE